MSAYAPGGLPVFPMQHLFLAHASSVAPSSNAFESNNRAAYFPIVISATCVARRLWWANGSSVSASYNVDVGIYRDDGGYKPGAKLVSTGSTAQGTASQVQFVDITDTTLGPGLYWLAIACSSTSATFMASTFGTYYDGIYRVQEASAFPLPASATPVESDSQAGYLFGFATTASP